MKRSICLLVIILGAVGTAWVAAKIQVSRQRYAEAKAEHEFDPAPGRIEFVSIEKLLAEPKKYHGKRLITAGVWSTGWECSFLSAEHDEQSFEISVGINWDKVHEPMGNLSEPKNGEPEFGNFSRRIVAEGTFFYSEKLVPNRSLLIDRLYRSEFMPAKVSTVTTASEANR